MREKVFSGTDTVKNFCAWLLSAQHRNLICIAHNAKSYDSFFIYNYILENSMRPEVIFSGNKIIMCKVNNFLNIKLIDSINFLPMPLSQLPKSFDLKELKKGYFPHLYNTEEMQQDESLTQLLEHPPAEYYDPGSMSEKKRREFINWYSSNRNKNFDFHQELLDYCRSDVDILLQACWKFRRLVMGVTKAIHREGSAEHPVDPFDYITLASLCMAIFRSKFLPEEWKILLKKKALTGCSHEPWSCRCEWSKGRKRHGDGPLEVLTLSRDERELLWIPAWQMKDEIEEEKFVSSPLALIPQNGYGRRDNFSRQSLEWISFFVSEFEKTHGLTIPEVITAETVTGEKIIRVSALSPKRYKADGFFRHPERENEFHVLEFNGCWYHGCPRCYPRDREKLFIDNKNLERRYAETVEKEKTLKSLGFVVHSMWSCDFEEEKKKNKRLQEWLKGNTFSDPINVRDAYFGGRTNALILNKTFRDGEKGGYADFCSLYPDVLKYRAYPQGHPVRITRDFAEPSRAADGSVICYPYFGIVKAVVRAPRNLHLPVLPCKINGKLMFPLCSSCAQNLVQTECRCPDDDRLLKGTWCSPEVEEALKVGYEIVETQEVLHWEQSSRDLFPKMINTFLKIKTESSDFPPEVKTEEEKDRYVREYFEHEGVELRKENIAKNAGLRTISKLLLNSFYGKFGQRTNMKKCCFVSDAPTFYSMLTDYSKTIKDFHVINENLMAVEYSLSPEFETVDPKTNPVIAAFCTTYARLKLWNLMMRLGDRILYHDTDSVIYSYKEGEYCPSMGKYLGELTNELECKEIGCQGCEEKHWITDFISCGPKNYAYKLNTGETMCKVRGFSLNWDSSKKINFESMRDCLIAWKEKKEAPDIVTVKTQFLRDKKKPKIYTTKMNKSYGVVYNKRIVRDDFSSFPYGFSSE